MKAILIGLLFSSVSWGACKAPEKGDNKVPAIYFGGNQSTSPQMTAWENKANGSSYGAKFKFEAHPLNGAKSNRSSVEASTRNEIQDCVNLINSPDFKGPIILIGHSDGSYSANAIIRAVNAKNRKKIKLVNLDGYASKGPEFDDVSVNCITAFSQKPPAPAPVSCSQIPSGAMLSAYHDEMVQCKGGCRAFGVKDCADKWCLHFSLANTMAAANKVTGGNWPSTGYVGVSPQLDFLKDVPLTVVDKPGAAAGQ